MTPITAEAVAEMRALLKEAPSGSWIARHGPAFLVLAERSLREPSPECSYGFANCDCDKYGLKPSEPLAPSSNAEVAREIAEQSAAEAERDDWRKLYYETIGFVAELERRCAELEGERDYWRSQVDADRKMVATVAAEEAVRPLQRRCAELEAVVQRIAEFEDRRDEESAIARDTMICIAKAATPDDGTPHLDKLQDDARREERERIARVFDARDDKAAVAFLIRSLSPNRRGSEWPANSE